MPYIIKQDLKNIHSRARAPLRLGMAGGGTDVSPYCDVYGGAVMNATIDRFIYSDVCINAEPKLKFISHDLGIEETFGLDDEFSIFDGLSLHKAVYIHIMQKYFDGERIPLTITTYSEAPAGSGLGSSSTLVVSVIAALADLLSLPLGEYDIAYLAYVIERKDLGFSGGRQDQYAAAFGGFNYMEFFADDVTVVNPLRIKSNVINELQLQTLLCFTGVSRKSAEIIQEQADNVKDKNEQSIDAMHHLKEVALDIKNGLLRGNIDAVSQALHAGWVSKKAMAKNISNTLIDDAVALALQAGATAGKISGAGGGGFILFMVPFEKRKSVISVLESKGFDVQSVQFTNEGVITWRV